MSAWVHVNLGGHTTVAGPFTGNGIVVLESNGIHAYPTQQAATSAPVQTLNQQQSDTLLSLSLAGPGIGQGFFGLGSDVKQAGSAVNPLTGIAAIGDFFQRLTQKNLWVRAGEFAVGGLLLYVGAKAVFPEAVSTAANTAKKTGKKVLAL